MSWLQPYSTNCSCARCPVFYDHVKPCDWTAQAPYPWLQQLAANTILVILALLALGLAISIKRRYNHILLIHRRVRTPSISNTPWIVFFVSAAVRMVFGVVRGMLYGTEDKLCQDLDVALFYCTSIASGTTMMALCFALDHQLKHRQGILWAAQTNAADYTATTTLSVNNATRTKSVSDRASVGNRMWDWMSVHVYILLWFELAVYYAVLLAQVTEHTGVKLILFKVFLGTVWAIHATKLMLTLAIVGDAAEQSPSVSTKVKVALASFLHSVTVLPPTVWTKIFPEQCSLRFATGVDVMFMIEGVAMVLYYSFMVDEFGRIKDTYLPQKFEQIRRNMNNHRRF